MTTIPVPPPVSVETILHDAWKLLRRNWVLVAPMLLAGVAVTALIVVIAVVAVLNGSFATGKMSNAAIATFAVGYVVMLLVVLAVAVVATDATFGMADAVWVKGTTSLGDGMRSARARFGATCVAFVGYIGLAIAALFLLIPTLGLALLAFPIVTMYALPAVVSGGFGGFAAFGESWRLVRRYFGISAIACLILIALQYVISLALYVLIVPIEIGMALAGNGQATPSLLVIGVLAVVLLVASLVMLVILYAYHAYYTLALVGLYRWLRARAAAEDAAASPLPAPLG